MYSVSLTIDSLDCATPEAAIEAFRAAIADGVSLAFDVYESATAAGPSKSVMHPAEDEPKVDLKPAEDATNGAAYLAKQEA